MVLFDQKERENLRYAKNKHNSYQFYDGSARKEFTYVRERMNSWFSRYPSNHRRQLRSDFKAQFDSAYFELFIHELFLKQGFRLEPHVNVGSSAKTPDFLGIKDGIELYIEAKVASDLSVKEVALNDRRNIILDAINEIPCRDFWLSIYRIEFKTAENPKISAIKTYIQQMIGQRREELKDIENYQNNPDLIKEYSYLDDRFELDFSLYPSAIEPDPFIVSQPGVAFCGGSDESIRKAVRDKANRYGVLDKPYIVCINATSYKYTTAVDAFNAMFGYHWPTGEGIQVIPSSDLTGIFNSKRPQFTNVSAVFITRTYPENPHSTEQWLIENPFAKKPLDFDKLDLSYFKLMDDHIVEIKKAGVPEILFGDELKTEVEIMRSFLVE